MIQEIQIYMIICFQEIILHDDPFGLAPVQEYKIINIIYFKSMQGQYQLDIFKLNYNH